MRKIIAGLFVLLCMLGAACFTETAEAECSHKFSDNFLHDANGHWLICPDCGEKFEQDVHRRWCYEERCMICFRSYTGSNIEHDVKWSGDAEYHWSMCNYCGIQSKKAMHERDCDEDACYICHMPYTGDNIFAHMECIWVGYEKEHWLKCLHCEEEFLSHDTEMKYDATHHWLACASYPKTCDYAGEKNEHVRKCTDSRCMTCLTYYKGDNIYHIGSQWIGDETGHWEVCYDCKGIKVEVLEHSRYCDEEICRICKLPYEGDNIVHHEEWAGDKANHFRFCTACDLIFEQGTHIRSCDSEKCNICGLFYDGENALHDPETLIWKNDGKHCWQECTQCGFALEKNEHARACNGELCAVCELPCSEENFFHTGDNRSDSEHLLSCSACGYVSETDDHRRMCDQYECVDYDCHRTYEGDNVIHGDGIWSVVTEPTVKKEGLREQRCEACNSVLATESIPKLEDDYDDNPAGGVVYAERGDAVTVNIYVSFENASTVSLDVDFDKQLFGFLCGEAGMGGMFVLPESTYRYSRNFGSDTKAYNEKIGTITLRVGDMVADGIYGLQILKLSAYNENGGYVNATATMDKIRVVECRHWRNCSENVCGKCNFTYTGHDVRHGEEKWIVVTEATKEADGLREKRCEKCEQVLMTEIIPKIYVIDDRFEINTDGMILSYCGNDAVVVIPDTINGIRVIGIGYEAFANNDSITNVIIPEGVSVIGNSAFKNCKGLKSITFPKSLTHIMDWAFDGCENLEHVYAVNIEAWLNISINGSINNPMLYADKLYFGGELVKTVTIPQDVTTIRNSAFANLCSLISVTIPEGVISIGDSAFSDCGNLANVMLPKSLTKIGSNAFGGCWSLKDIVIPDGVTSIEWNAFHHCTSLKNVVLPKGLSLIDNQVFYNCTGLESIVIPEGVTSIGNNAFLYCFALKDITLPESLRSIGESSFDGCISLVSIAIPDKVISLGHRAFGSCTSLISVDLPDELTSLGSSVFFSCSSLTNISLPDGLTSIGNNSFSYCNSLTEIVLPDGMISIGSNAFHMCTALTDITIPESVTEIGKSAMNGDTCAYAKVKCGSFAHEWCVSNYVKLNVQHTEVLIEAVAPTYRETGLTEGKRCTICGNITDEQEIVPVLNCSHPETTLVGGEAGHWNECTVCGNGLGTEKHIRICDQSVCMLCGFAYMGDNVSHIGGDAIKCNEIEHWKICSGCSAHIETEEHRRRCDEDVCFVCNHSYSGNRAKHIEPVSGTDMHVLSCSACGYQSELDSHVRYCNGSVCKDDGCGLPYDGENFAHKWWYWVTDTNTCHMKCVSCGYQGNWSQHQRYCDNTECIRCGTFYAESRYVHREAVMKNDAQAHWEYCNTCGFEWGYQEHTDFIVHRDSKTHWLICSVCNYTGDKTGHIRYCDQQECFECGQAYSGKSILHRYEDVYHGDETGHWMECVGCGQASEKMEHDRLCSETACSVCAAAYTGMNIKHDSHWIGNETSHWESCSDCGFKSGKNQHKRLCNEEVCALCDLPYRGDVVEHCDIRWIGAEDGHFEACMTCGKNDGELYEHARYCNEESCMVCRMHYTGENASKHIEAVTPGIPATHATTGISDGITCSECGAVVSGREEIPMVDVLQFRVPESIVRIESYAFADTRFPCVVLPDGCRRIEAHAYAGNSQLLFVEIPASVEYIGEKAFDNCSDDLIIVTVTGSYAQQYAMENGIACVLKDGAVFAE